MMIARTKMSQQKCRCRGGNDIFVRKVGENDGFRVGMALACILMPRCCGINQESEMHPATSTVISLMEEVMDTSEMTAMQRAQVMLELAKALGGPNVEVEVKIAVTMIDVTTDTRTEILTADIDPGEYM